MSKGAVGKVQVGCGEFQESKAGFFVTIVVDDSLCNICCSIVGLRFVFRTTMSGAFIECVISSSTVGASLIGPILPGHKSLSG
jgi:hypothetical protein